MDDGTSTTPPQTTFGERVKAARKAAGFDSQEDLARALGVSVFTISRYEHGRSKPSFDGLYALAEILGVRVSDLLPNDGEAAA